MSEAKTPAGWFGDRFWDRLDRLEARHRRLQSDHVSVRRGLEQRICTVDADFLRAWRNYCEVLAELDRVTAEFGDLKPCLLCPIPS